jgi:6-pyruvoyltetrahydropterin/6-carboxytetrahydropterin synthase
MGHRLSKHEGCCSNIHGHNFVVMVGVKSKTLDSGDMVIDFSKLKDLVQPLMDMYDHSTTLNECDLEKFGKPLADLGMKVNILTDGDPTAEHLSKEIYDLVKQELLREYPWVEIDYITVYENENSKATYTE